MGSDVSRINNEEKISQNNSINNRKCLTDDHETHVSEGAEGELHTRNAVCEKNPGHTKFIPVDTFTLEHLPEGQRDNDLYEYIKAVADLTVKVNVYMASPHRPEFWPRANQPYPFYNMREPEVLRTGSGMIYNMYTFTEGVRQGRYQHLKHYTKCWCRKCEHSDSPSKVWWEFDVFTAAHVVFDDIEASRTSLRLFYDSKDSPVVIVDKVSVVGVNIEYDMSELKCVTCDKNLGDELEKMWKHNEDVREKVWNKYKNSRSVDKLNFIVSHPHGCTKQVSVGHWIKKYKVGKYDRKFTYTTCTCPGSSGAKIYCIGCRCWMWFYTGPVHSGTHSKHKYNYSGVGHLFLLCQNVSKPIGDIFILLKLIKRWLSSRV